MPGRLRSSYRQGNLAEDLGLLLLKGISAVAEVARPEDVGLDAIATLLRRDDDGNCYAEDTFLVQLKSPSAKSIEYEAHELDWLVAQSQPMFIGIVSLADSTISLYPTIFVNQAVLSLHARKVTVRFGTSDIEPGFVGQKYLAWRSNGEDDATVWLGDPLMRWSVTDIGDHQWTKSAYEMLKSFLAILQHELVLLSFGQFSIINWSTNDSTSIRTNYGMMKQNEEIQSVAERCMPSLHALSLQASSMRSDCGMSLLVSLVDMAAALRKVGVEIDQNNFFVKHLQFWILHRESDGTQDS